MRVVSRARKAPFAASRKNLSFTRQANTLRRAMATRILYVHNSADIYGASRSLVRLMKNLNREQFLPLVVLPEQGPLQTKLEELNVKVLIHPSLSVITRSVFRSWRILLFFLQFPFSVFFFWRLIRKNEIDLVHTNTGVILSPALAAKLTGIPHIWHIRDWFQEFKGMWGPYAKYILWSSRRVIAVSRAIAGQFPDQSKLVVVHNGFSLDEFAVPKEKLAREFRERFGLSNQIVVGCVGRIKLVRKGQEVLIQAANLLKKKGVNAKFVIIGSVFTGNENHLEELKRMVREFNLEQDVVFTGELADPKPAYAAMDIFVLPSAQPEPFGGVVMEAMSMGVPVIATNIGGSIDQVAEGVTGYLVPPSDPAALAEKIEKLIQDETLRKQMSAAGPKRIAEHFSLPDMVRKFETIYCEAMA